MNTAQRTAQPIEGVKYEAVLIWSHAPVSDINKSVGRRSAYAFNRVFDQKPDTEVLAGVVAAKQAEIEANPLAHPDPQFHRLEVRTVTTELADLESIVAEYNAGQ